MKTINRLSSQEKSVFTLLHLLIKTARAFALVGETRWPAPQSETVIVAKGKV
jgi:hypothetical protein